MQTTCIARWGDWRPADHQLKIANRALNLPVTQQDLHSAQIAGRFVDDRGLGPAERIRAVVVAAQADPGNPLIYKPGVLARAQVSSMIETAREYEVVQSTSTSFKPCEHAGACRLKQLELHRPTGLLLNDDHAGAHLAAADQTADTNLDEVAAAQLAILRP